MANGNGVIQGAGRASVGIARGFSGLPCLYCGETDCVTLELSDMTGEEALLCGQCETGYSVADALAKITAWLPVLAWIEQAPVLAE